MNETKLLAAALAAAQAEFPRIPKTKVARVKTKSGAEYSYKYCDLADVLAVVLPILAKNQLAFCQLILHRDGDVFLASRLLHSSREVLGSDGIALPQGAEPQVFGSALTYARRYDGCAMLGIAPDEDDDGSLATRRDVPSTGKKKSAKQPELDISEQDVREAASEFITAGQRRRIFAIGRARGLSEAQIREAVGACGFEHTSEIPKRQYEHVVQFLEGK